jgi:hypothetical protein
MISLEALKKAAEDGRPRLRTRQDAEPQSGDQDRPAQRRRDLVE